MIPSTTLTTETDRSGDEQGQMRVIPGRCLPLPVPSGNAGEVTNADALIVSSPLPYYTPAASRSMRSAVSTSRRRTASLCLCRLFRSGIRASLLQTHAYMTRRFVIPIARHARPKHLVTFAVRLERMLVRASSTSFYPSCQTGKLLQTYNQMARAATSRPSIGPAPAPCAAHPACNPICTSFARRAVRSEVT